MGAALEMSNDKFDAYKFFLDNTLHLSERRQAATQTYITVNTAIFAILALLVKEAGLKGWYLVGATLPLFLVGILACLIWYKIITQYNELIDLRYRQLINMALRCPGATIAQFGGLFHARAGEGDLRFFALGGLAATSVPGFILNVRDWSVSL